MLKLLTHIFRVIVGGLFVFSGYVKIVDPIGSQYKFEEYFSESVLNMEFLIPYALPFAILLIIAEIGLGVFLLIGYRPKFTTWSTFLIMLVFLFLTWYSAYYNKVTDCGCFGDAVKLSPWETFYKNVFLFPMTIFLIWRAKDIVPIFPKKATKIVAFASIFTFFYITYHVLVHLPLVDFRPYAIGKNIPEGMEYKGDGEIPPVHDFMLESAEEDLTEKLLTEEKVMLIIVYNLDKADVNGFPTIKNVAKKAITEGYTVYGVSASFDDDLIAAQSKYDLPFSFLFCDETTLKTIIRANPGIVILNKGTVTQKYNWTDADKLEL